MGETTFWLPSPLPPGGASAVSRARLRGGYDRTPFPTALRHAGDKLVLARAESESGYVSAPWPVPGVGCPVTTSATLRLRPEPYRLLTELARGKLNQIRTQAAEWALVGLHLPDAAQADLAAATRAFGRAVLADVGADADAAATDVLAHAYRAADAAARTYAAACAAAVRARPENRTRYLGSRLDRRPGPEFAATFNACRIVPDWAAIEPTESRYDWAPLDELVEWAAESGTHVTVGPLIDLASDRLPEWLAEWRGELPSIAAFLCDFVETAVHRYRDRVSDWLLFSGFNHASALDLGEDDRLELAYRLLTAARAADPEARWSVGLSLPWGDYLENDEYTYSPLVFADTLLRTGLPVAGFEFEFLAGDGPRAGGLRDGLDTLQLLELFGVFGVPLEIACSHPGRAAAGDSTADLGAPNNLWLGSASAAAQAEWGALVTRLGLSMPHVRAAWWGRWQDDATTADGLFDAGGAAKPLLGSLADLRAELIDA